MAEPLPAPSTRSLARLVPASLVVGVLSALTLLALSALANKVEDLVWTQVPRAWGLDASGGDAPWWWTVVVLTVTGLLVGAVLQWSPGHGGNDPLTAGLVDAPLPLRTLPGLAVALVLGLAGGVSLGPENPIIALNMALAVWLVLRRSGTADRATAAAGAVGLATAGTIGAMFATPVAAALLLTETFAEGGQGRGRLLDRLFGPLVAASAGSLTMMLVGAPTFSVDVGDYHPSGWDLLSSPATAIVATAVMALGGLLAPVTHALFHRLPSPVLALGLGGLVLGILGAVGGPLTLFKGLEEMKELAHTADQRTWAGLAAIALIKVLAVVVAAASGFRGGRIFPAVFVGVAVGLAVSALVPAIPASVAVAGGVLGAALGVSHDAWLALFISAVTVGNVDLIPLLGITLAPVWLITRGLPLFQLAPRPEGEPEFGHRPRVEPALPPS